jgi:hypothetical protein
VSTGAATTRSSWLVFVACRTESLSEPRWTGLEDLQDMLK